MSNINASAKNMEAVSKAKKAHNNGCPWGGDAQRVLLNPFDIERMGWEEGDVIVGLTVMADEKITTGMMRVECDAEPNATPTISKENFEHLKDQVDRNKELTPA